MIIVLSNFNLLLSHQRSDRTEVHAAFSPPSWIQGAWVDNVSSSTGYKFDSIDMIWLYLEM